VRKLPAVEALGSTTVICTDKTGTLTAGEMTVRALYVDGQSYEVTGEGYGPDGEVRFEGKKAEAQHAAPLLELATILLGCNNAHLVQENGTWKVIGDPTEGALLAAGPKASGNQECIEKELPKQHEIPFDSDRKRSTAIRRMPDGKLRAFTNGAPGVLMTLCVAVGFPAPLLPIHLLWINLVTDGLPALCLATDPIDPDVMKRHPRRRSERITDRSFLRTMCLTGFLTAGVAFAVYLYVLKKGNPETARTCAFAVLVFAELLRSFGGRSETKPVWRIPFFTNINLAIVVSVSFGLQVWSQHSATLGRFLKTSFMPLTDCLWLLAAGTIPLLMLEMVKLVRNKRRCATKSSTSTPAQDFPRKQHPHGDAQHQRGGIHGDAPGGDGRSPGHHSRRARQPAAGDLPRKLRAADGDSTDLKPHAAR